MRVAERGEGEREGGVSAFRITAGSGAAGGRGGFQFGGRGQQDDIALEGTQAEAGDEGVQGGGGHGRGGGGEGGAGSATAPRRGTRVHGASCGPGESPVPKSVSVSVSGPAFEPGPGPEPASATASGPDSASVSGRRPALSRPSRPAPPARCAWASSRARTAWTAAESALPCAAASRTRPVPPLARSPSSSRSPSSRPLPSYVPMSSPPCSARRLSPCRPARAYRSRWPCGGGAGPSAAQGSSWPWRRSSRRRAWSSSPSPS